MRNAWKALEATRRALSLIVLPVDENAAIGLAGVELCSVLPKIEFNNGAAEKYRKEIIEILHRPRKLDSTAVEQRGSFQVSAEHMKRKTKAKLGSAILQLFIYLQENWQEEPADFIG